MAEQLVPDEVWTAIQPLLPPKPPHPKGGPAPGSKTETNRRLTVRYERRVDILTAFLQLACALVCARKFPPL